MLPPLEGEATGVFRGHRKGDTTAFQVGSLYEYDVERKRRSL
jgi:hypothetical protein